jgi:hypothetical protein
MDAGTADAEDVLRSRSIVDLFWSDRRLNFLCHAQRFNKGEINVNEE